MATQINPRDWEAVSAYLDHELNEKERIQIEARLKREPDLYAALEGLRRTRLVLRLIPNLRAPRNFTLTASMAGIKRDQRAYSGAYPLFRLASLLATIFFVMISAGSFAIRMNQPAQSVVMRSEVENAQPAPFFGFGGGAVEAPAPALAPMPTQEEMTAKMESEMLPSEPGAIQVTPLAKAMTTPTAEALQAFSAPLETTVIDDMPPAAKESPAVPQDGWTIWSWVIFLQVSLAILALTCAAAAIYLRRNPTH